MTTSVCHIDKDALKLFIIQSLVLVDSCISNFLTTMIIEHLWKREQRFSGCDTTLQFLLTYRSAVLAVMSCYVFQVDYTEGHGNDSELGSNRRADDGYSGAQSSNQSFRVADSCAKAQYDDFSCSLAELRANRVAHSESHDAAFSYFRDMGNGFTASEACSDSFTEGKATSYNSALSTEAARRTGSRKGCTYQFNKSDGASASRAKLFGIQNGSFDAASWDYESNNSTKSNSSDRRESASERENDSASRTRMGSRRDSCGTFQNNVHTCGQGTHESFADDNSKSLRTAFARAEGEGSSFARSDARSNSGSQSSATGHSDYSARYDSSKNALTVVDSVKANQRYKHLQDIYSALDENVKARRKYISGQVRPSIKNYMARDCEIGCGDGLTLYIPTAGVYGARASYGGRSCSVGGCG